MIDFRHIVPSFRKSEPFKEWHVEYYNEDENTMFPVGTAYVVILETTVQLNFILVADQWRRRGIGRQLVEACRKRWPNIQLTIAMEFESSKSFFEAVAGPHEKEWLNS